MRVRVNDDIELNYELSGDGEKVIVLTHGMGGSLRNYDPEIEALSKKYRVLRYDVRGHGDSDRPDIEYGPEMYARDLAGLLEALGIAKVYAGGESQGGAITQRFLLDFPEMTEAGFLLCTSSEVGPKMAGAWEARAVTAETEGTAAALEASARFANANSSVRPMPPDEEERGRAETLKIPGKIYARIVRAMAHYNWTQDLRRLRIPVLILQGLQDTMTPPGGSVIMHRNIPGSQLIMIDRASHSIRWDQPDEWRRHLLNFLDGVDAWGRM
jgi:3-oxoadipate enol-lactonase